MSRRRRFLVALLVLVTGWPTRADLSRQSTFTVSNTITVTDDQPLSGIQVSVRWSGGGETQTTWADGTCHVSDVPAGGPAEPMRQNLRGE